MPVAIGQVSRGTSSGGTSATTTAVNTTATGSTFIVMVSTGTANTVQTPTDNFGNIYTLVRATATAAEMRCHVFHIVNGTGGTNHQVTATITAGVKLSAFFAEVTGAGASDGENAIEDDASPYTSPGVTTTVAADILIGYLAGPSATTPATHGTSGASPTSGWTIPAGSDETDATFWVGCLSYQVVSATGTYNSGFTENGAGVDAIAGILTYTPGGPVITAQPADTSAYNGFTANFTVTATGGTLTYQWQVSTDRCATYGNVPGGSGATTTSYTTATLAFSDHETFYRCAVTDAGGTTNTRGAALRITPRSNIAWLRN